MKRALTIGALSVALAATLTIVTAWSRSPQPVADADALPASDIVARAGEMGLDPVGAPHRRGPFYVLHAQDARGREMRVVADAQSGDIVSVAPVRPVRAAYAPPRLSSAPRIIHVPQPGDEVRAGRSGDALDVDDVGDVDEAPPPPRKIKPQRKSDAPQEPRRRPFAKSLPEVKPAPVERRTVLRAPASLHDGPSPIRPTPRFTANAESGEKFAPAPPAGYAPPAKLPTGEAPPSAEPESDAAPADTLGPGAAQGD